MLCSVKCRMVIWCSIAKRRWPRSIPLFQNWELGLSVWIEFYKFFQLNLLFVTQTLCTTVVICKPSALAFSSRCVNTSSRAHCTNKTISGISNVYEIICEVPWIKSTFWSTNTAGQWKSLVATLSLLLCFLFGESVGPLLRERCCRKSKNCQTWLMGSTRRATISQYSNVNWIFWSLK